MLRESKELSWKDVINAEMPTKRPLKSLCMTNPIHLIVLNAPSGCWPRYARRAEHKSSDMEWNREMIFSVAPAVPDIKE